MNALISFQKEFRKLASPDKAMALRRFFKTGKGQYGEGDKFLGIMVPQIRQLVKKFSRIFSIPDAVALLHSPYHEERLAALFIMVEKFKKGSAAEQEKIFSAYLHNYKYINNWDLVDLSAPHIVGAYLENKNKKIIYGLAGSANLWKKRIAVLSLFYFIRKGECGDALAVIEKTLRDKHDLMHKACGWMLREIGKNCGQAVLEKFLQRHVKAMPRTCLRYAIEKFPEPLRQKYLKNT